MPRTRRQLLAVMFTDIVGYSAMVNRDERAAQRLLEYQRRAVREQVFRHEGRIVDVIGDGHLITFANARAAIECAVALQRELQQRNAQPGAEPLRLRIGIHVGDIERGPRRVFGDGVNVAARLEPLAPHGGIAASAQAVAQLHGDLRAAFASQGPRQLKNIAEPYELFALVESALEGAARQVPPPRPWRLAWRRRRRTIGLTALALGMAAVAVVGWRALPPAEADPSRIAVLPLQNLSGADSADFVAGLHDSLLTEVSRARELKVISRTSVMRYATDTPPVPEIAHALKVAWVLEGSVQRSGPRVRINVQLIRARNDEHVWAHTYDRDTADLFEVQTQIAREIAHSTESQVGLGALPAAHRPTSNAAAYELYLRAIALEDNDPKLGREPATEQIALLQQATTLDPDFALAWAALARYNVWSANWASYVQPDRRAGYLSAASAAERRARMLAPNEPESLVASALVLYWNKGDPAQVARDLEAALRARPGYSLALFWLGNVCDRLGDEARSTAALQALRQLDPYNERVYTQLAQQLLNRHAYAELAATYAEWRAITESPAFVDYWAVQAEFYRTGNLEPWKEFLAQPVGPGVTEDDLRYSRGEVALYEHRLRDVAALDRAEADAFLAGTSTDFSAALATGDALVLDGDRTAAAPYLDAAERYLAKVLKESSDATALMVATSVAVARHDEPAAMARARQAVELTRPAAGAKPSRLFCEARRIEAEALARFGHKAEALAALDWVLGQPCDVHAHAVLRDPHWAPLDRDPDFQALVRRHLPAA